MKRTARIVTAIALLLGLSAAWSQTYPSRPIHIVVAFPPGGAIDPIARTVAEKLNDAWHQPVIVDNKPGAATIIGTEFVAKAPPDGYTVILASASFSVNAAMYSKLPYDTVKDFAPVSLVSRLPLLLVVNPALPVHSVKEFIDYLKAHPGKVNFSSIGAGTTQHLSAELFKSVAGVNMVHVPYKGSGPSMMSVVSGETQATFESVFLLSPQIKAGKLRALAAAGPQRSPLWPDVPTVAESGLPGYQAVSWTGLVAPAKTPAEVVNKMSREVARIMQLPDVRERQINQGLEPVGSTPEFFADFIKTEIAKWAKVAKEANIKLD